MIKKKVSAIIQVRTGSKRFPRKSLAKLGDSKIIEWGINRTKQSKFLDEVILATSDLEEDKLFLKIAKEHSIKIFFGEKENVLKRFLDTAKYFSTDVVVRICADNPFISHSFIDELIKFFEKNNCDLAFNHQTRLNTKIVDGFGAEIFNKKILEKIFNSTNEKAHLEHVTQFIWDNHQKMNIKACPVKDIFMNSDLKFDVDYKEDLVKLNNFVLKHKINFKTLPENIVKCYE